MANRRTVVKWQQPPDWSSVRPIYKKLSDEFGTLLHPYGIDLSDERKTMMDHLIVVIDEVDQCIDGLETKAQRDDITAGMVAFLEGPEPVWEHPAVSVSFAAKMSTLKAIIEVLGATDRFVQAARNIFRDTEAKRHVLQETDLIRLVKQEGAATAELPLSIMGVPADHPFAHFFAKLCMLMGIADLIVDARSDYREGLIKLVPSIRLYWQLNLILITEGLGLLWRFPRKLSFLWYCIRFSWTLLRDKPVDVTASNYPSNSESKTIT